MLPDAPRHFELLTRDLYRPQISHVIFDFDGTLSWLRHGWPRIMEGVFLDHAPAAWRTDRSVRERLMSEILGLNGKPSIHQMRRFCDLLREAKHEAVPDPEDLLAQYDRALKAEIHGRKQSLSAGAAPEGFHIFGALPALQELRRRGRSLIILSGTVQPEVREEAALLRFNRFFGEHIYGSDATTSFSKQQVIERILRDERIEGRHLLAFGDGPMEIAFTKEAGGMAIGVASDESDRESHRVDPLKREPLVRAGADAILPDYAEVAALWPLIFGA